jgi:hypothetical protein
MLAAVAGIDATQVDLGTRFDDELLSCLGNRTGASVNVVADLSRMNALWDLGYYANS